MSKHRIVKSEFWVDDYFEDLPVKERYFFLYLLTNPETNILGIYKTTIKRMSFETGLSKSDIELFIDKFSGSDKVHFVESHIIMVNHHKHQMPSSTMKKGIEKLIMQLPFEVTGFILSKKSNIYNRLSIGYGVAIHSSHKDKDKDINKSKDKDINLPPIEKTPKIVKYSEVFERYWKIFPPNPTHGKGDKGKAYAEFLKIPKEDYINLKAGTENYEKTNGGSYKCARFLKEEIWKVHIKKVEQPDPKNSFSKKQTKSLDQIIEERRGGTSPDFDIEIQAEA